MCLLGERGECFFLFFRYVGQTVCVLVRGWRLAVLLSCFDWLMTWQLEAQVSSPFSDYFCVCVFWCSRLIEI